MGITADHDGPGLIVTGASGRLGRILGQVWHAAPPGFPVRFLARRPGFDGSWPGGEPWPEGAVILHLAGVTRGDAAELAANVTLARQAAIDARESGARALFLASSVAVYRPGPEEIDEAMPPDPVSPYGAAKREAERVMVEELAGSAIAAVALRIANVAGADALLGGARARPGQRVQLDPVPGQPGGPLRSYLGPVTLGKIVSTLAGMTLSGRSLPPVLNIAQPGGVAMADLLKAAHLPWGFGPARDAVVPRVIVATDRLAALMALAPATPAGLVAETAMLDWTAT